MLYDICQMLYVIRPWVYVICYMSYCICYMLYVVCYRQTHKVCYMLYVVYADNSLSHTDLSVSQTQMSLSDTGRCLQANVSQTRDIYLSYTDACLAVADNCHRPSGPMRPWATGVSHTQILVSQTEISVTQIPIPDEARLCMIYVYI